MAKYNVTHTCGHDYTHQLCGKQTDRYSRLDWLATKECSDCYNARQKKIRDAANTANARQAQETGLAPLTGSPKQIAWAETVRMQYMRVFNFAASSADVTDEAKKQCAAIKDWMISKTSAGWWIDNRVMSRDPSQETLYSQARDIYAAANK